MNPLKIKPSPKKHIFKFIWYTILSILVSSLPFIFPKFQEKLFILVGLSIGSLLLNLIYTYFYTLRYEITLKESGVEFEYGIFNRTTETIEMHRINDFVQYQDFDDMIFKLASITVHSTDKTTPVVHFKGLNSSDARKMLEFLQEFASDSLVKHLNKLDEIPRGKGYKKAIQQSSMNKRKPQEP